MSITLRPYQVEDIETLLAAIASGEHPVANVATGGGKGIYAAEIPRRVDCRVLCVTDRKELIAQNESQYLRTGGDDFGVYSAGLGRRDTDARVIFAGVQSIYNRMSTLQQAGPFGLVIVDEAHMVASRGTDSMYNTVLDACKDASRIGLTATPFRLKDGPNSDVPIYGLPNSWFTCCPVNRSIKDLVAMGYLSKLVGVRTVADVDVSNVRIRGGEFVTSDLSQASIDETVVNAALDEVCYLARDRRSWLMFGVDIAHCMVLTQGLQERGIDAMLVTGKTPGEARDQIIAGFKRGTFRALVNCQVLTTGFDAPGVDCVALLRATQSKGLCIQMLGRGSRLSPDTGKVDCLVLDLAGNLERHTPIEDIPIMRSPKLIEKENLAAAEEQASRDRQLTHGTKASSIDPLGAEPLPPQMLRVHGVTYFIRPARKYPTRDNLIMTYKCQTEDGRPRSVTQFVLCEYPGPPGERAKAWFDRRGMVMPGATRYALQMARRGPAPEQILVVKKGKWDEVIMEYFGEDDE